MTARTVHEKLDAIQADLFVVRERVSVVETKLSGALGVQGKLYALAGVLAGLLASILFKGVLP